MTLESQFQASLIVELRELFPGCIILKNDANALTGFPDLLILYGSKWVVLECKASRTSPYQPNQEYYLDLLGKMAYASVIYPEVKDMVLNEVQQALRSRR